MPAPHEITATQLARLVGTPDAPLVLDLRIDEDFDDDPRMIPASRRHAFAAVEEIPFAPGERVVVLCQKGRKISQGAAALLRAQGVAAEVLLGGQIAWAQAGLPMVKANAIPLSGRWVTRQRPKVDRIACPWLVRRFVDPQAAFLFVPPDDVALVAERFGAVSFDAPGASLSHEGDRCTFDAMLDRFGLDSEPLQRMAAVIRGADTDRHDIAPEAAGLLAVSLGLSRSYRDDNAQLDAGMLVYDALYRWARDAVGEGHRSDPQAGEET